MAKIYGINGVITGKLGAAVYAVRNGEQISRQYQPIVANPNTNAQIAARAKLKLMSQLSAIMAPVIAIPRMGSVSSRNMFTKVNYPATTYNNDKADIDMAAVKITKSVVSLPAIIATRGTTNTEVALQFSGSGLSRVVFIMFLKDGENIRYRGSVVQNEAGLNGTFDATLPSASGEAFIYAYGVRDNTANARAIFGNLVSPTGQDIAEIVTSRMLTESDITLTETKYVNLAAPSN